MAKFAYNTNKNTSTKYMFLELKCSYHRYVSFEKDTNLYFQSEMANKLSKKLQKLMIVCCKNLHYTENF